MKSSRLSRVLGSDVFGLIVLAIFTANRSVFSWLKGHTEDVLVYKENPEITSTHWIEALIPIDAWTIIWAFVSLFSVVAIFCRVIRPTVTTVSIALILIWGISQTFSPQDTSTLTGVLWLTIALLIIWGSGRIPTTQIEHLYDKASDSQQYKTITDFSHSDEIKRDAKSATDNI